MNEVEEKMGNSLKLLIRKDIDLVRIIIDPSGDHRLCLSKKATNLKTKICRNEDILHFSQYFFEQDGTAPTEKGLIILCIEFIVMCIMRQTNITGYLKKHNIKNVDKEDIFQTLVALFLLDAKKVGLIDL